MEKKTFQSYTEHNMHVYGYLPVDITFIFLSRLASVWSASFPFLSLGEQLLGVHHININEGNTMALIIPHVLTNLATDIYFCHC